MNKMHIALICSLMTAFFSTAGHALRAEEPEIERTGFTGIWDQIKSNSHASKAAASDSKAAEIMKNRQSRHWLPRIYADARSYASNDPGMTFMSNMGQRSIISNDFSPDNLNHPGTHLYQKGTIGIDLPIYEGGAGTGNAKAAEKNAEAKRYRRNSIYLNEFSASASAYAKIIVLKHTIEELSNLHNSVFTVLSQFEGGMSSNPVENSGILGLKALRNRIEALIAENTAELTSFKNYLEEMSGQKFAAQWRPSETDAVVFSDNYFKVSDTAHRDTSYRVKEMNAIAESSRIKAESEKSIFLPKVGIFSEANIYNGKRDSADSYTAGVYVRMNILAPTEYGSVQQAQLESEAAYDSAKDAQRNEEIKLNRLYLFSNTLRSNIKTLKESTLLMDEQVRNSRKLYASGSIKSFQLADALSRKADLITSLSEAEERYVETRSGIYTLSGKTEVFDHE